ncbi:MAG: CinA family protein [Dehalococcoidia bacterium]|nr:MAG: CinA family protein [Dehalococcoidia bacterium]
MLKLEQEIIDLLRKKGLTLGVTESATGGLISHIITNVPGSSEIYKGSVTAYANQTKTSVLGVKTETLQQYGAVSSQVAEEMALGGCRVLAADICLSDTGIAGPGGATPGKPVGLFYLGLAHRLTAYSQKHLFRGDREDNKERAARAALNWLKTYLLNLG